MGYSVEDYLGKLAEDIDSGDVDAVNPSAAKDLITYLRRSLNTGICMKASQTEATVEDILGYTGEDSKFRRELLNTLNLFDLGCGDCKNEDCDSRDSKIPIPISVARSLRVVDIGFTVRTENCLNNANVNTLGDLCERTEGEMMKRENFGNFSLREVKAVLAEHGLSLKDEETMFSPLESSTDEVTVALRAALPLPTIRSLEILGVKDAEDLSRFSDSKLRLGLGGTGFKHLNEAMILAGLKPPVNEGVRNVADLSIGRRIIDCLAKERIVKIPDLQKKSELELIRIMGIGETSVAQISRALRICGKELRKD